jgi:PAS domain S-box-containing protein
MPKDTTGDPPERLAVLEEELDTVAFLAEASKAFSESLSYERTLQNVARVLVPAFAEWCTLHAVGDDGRLERVAAVHADPDKEPLVQELSERYPPREGTAGGVLEVLVTGEPLLREHVDEEQLEAGAHDDHHASLIRELGMRSYLLLPLQAHGRVVGVLALVRDAGRPAFDSRDVSLGTEVASRAALAVDNARLFRDLQDSQDRLRQLIGSVDGWFWEAGPDAERLTFVSERAEQLVGYPVSEWLEPGFLERLVAPEDLERAVGVRREALDSGEAAGEYRIVTADGGALWVRDLVHAERDEEGSVTTVRGLMLDVTDQRRSERRREVEYAAARVLAQADSLPEVTRQVLHALCDALDWDLGEFWVVDESQGVLRLVESGAATGAPPGLVSSDYVELGRGSGLPGRAWEQGETLSVSDVRTDPAFARPQLAERLALHAAVATPIVGEDRVLAVMAFYATRELRPGQELMDTLGHVGVQIGQFIERRAAVDALRESERRTAFLADAASALGASLSPQETMSRLTSLLIPDVADACLVHLEGRWPVDRRLVATRGDAVQLRLVERLLRSLPSASGSGQALTEVVRSRKPQLVPEIGPRMLDELTYDDIHLGLLRDMEPRSAMFVPLVARGRTLGALVLLGTGGRRAYTPAELELIGDLGWTAASALENARLFDELRANAEILQRGLLPRAMPDVPGVEIAARYRAAGEGLEVGGDFYDVFPSSRRTWGVAIGDVAGKGAEAAALTALARYTLRTLALQAKRPSEALAALNDAVLREAAGERFCSAIYGHLEPMDEGCRLMWASGGHPLPYLLSNNRVRQIGRPGTVLGVVTAAPSHDELVVLHPGEALVLYTDGVIEGRGERGRFGEEQLAELLASVAGADAESIAGAVERAAVAFQDGELSDDLAVLVIRVPN